MYTVLKNILELLFLYFHFISSSWKYHIQNISNVSKKERKEGGKEGRRDEGREKKQQILRPVSTEYDPMYCDL